ncbi:MAG: glycosyltransferase [Pseudomonadota bacterium]
MMKCGSQDMQTLLPRLAYIGDVPIESSYHGSALMFRLLQDYPADRLLIIEAGLESSLPTRRLPNVDYLFAPEFLRRLQFTRFSSQYEAFRVLMARHKGRLLARRLASFRPSAVLSVSHGTSWIAAAQAAKILDVPLHLICHDEWAKLPSKLISQDYKEALFGKIYRGASSRLCVSPFMIENYARRFGPVGEVLYPSRARDAVFPTVPPHRFTEPGDRLVCCFAGSINSPGYARALSLVAEELLKIGGELHIFGPVDAIAGESAGLTHPNIRFRGLLSSSDLIETMRAEVDVLFVPMSFDPADRENMELSFPSKLTDYTLAGLPLLFFGPDYCSAVRWSQIYDGLAEVVTAVSGEGLSAALGRLSEFEVRERLGQKAVDVGDQLFSFTKARDTFYRALKLGLQSPGNEAVTHAS